MRYKKRKRYKLLRILAVVVPMAILVPVAVAFALATDVSSKNNGEPVYTDEDTQNENLDDRKPTQIPEDIENSDQEGSTDTNDKDNSENGDASEVGDKDVSEVGDKDSFEAGDKDNIEEDVKDNAEDDNEGNSESDKDDSLTNSRDYGSPLPKSETVGDEYFEDAIFIGNSQTEGFALYSGLRNIRAYFDKGVMVDTVFTKPAINRNGKKIPIMEAVAADADFSKAYIMLGMNELGWVSLDIFAEKYGKIIDTIREINPNAIIYVQSILPVAKSKSDKDEIYNNKRIHNFNEHIRAMCKEKEVYYLNVAEAVSDENGVLPEDAAFDGVHLNMKYCQKWLEYLKNHTITEDN